MTGSARVPILRASMSLPAESDTPAPTSDDRAKASDLPSPRLPGRVTSYSALAPLPHVRDLLPKHLSIQGLGVLRGAPEQPASERQTAGAARINPAPIERAAAGAAFPSRSAREDQCGDEPCNEYPGDDCDHGRQRRDPGHFYGVKARPASVPAEGIHYEHQACGSTDDSRHDVGNDGREADRPPPPRLRTPLALPGHGRSVGRHPSVLVPCPCGHRSMGAGRDGQGGSGFQGLRATPEGAA